MLFFWFLANTQDKADKVSGYALSFATNNVAGVLSVEPIDGEFLKNIPLVNIDRFPGKHEYAVLGTIFRVACFQWKQFLPEIRKILW